MDESAEIWDDSANMYAANSSKVHTFKGSIDYLPFEDFKAMKNFYDVSAKSSFRKTSYLNASVESVLRFFTKYIVQLGFLDGNLGYKIAKLSFDNVWLQYESYLEELDANAESGKTSIRTKKVKMA